MTKQFIFFLLCLTFVSCYAQRYKTLEDIAKISKLDKTFAGKPLRELLKEIIPSIKYYTTDRQGGGDGELPYFMFRFIDERDYISIRKQGFKFMPLTLRVFVRDTFSWNLKEIRKRNNGEITWTAEDLKKYGNLIIVAMSPMGRISDNTLPAPPPVVVPPPAVTGGSHDYDLQEQ